MDRTKTERAVVGLLLLAAVFLVGLFVGRGWRSEEILQLPVPVSAPAAEPLSEPAAEPSAPQRLDINTATAMELEQLPGIGPTLAARIVEYRAQNGAFLSAEELLGVQGIGEKTLSELKAYITVGQPGETVSGGK